MTLKNRKPGDKIRKMMAFGLGLAALFLIFGIIAGCEKVEKSTSTQKPIQACSILAKADVEAIFDSAVDEPSQTGSRKEEQNWWMSSCSYKSTSKKLSASVMIQNSNNSDPAKAFEAHEAGLKKALGDNYKLSKVEGIGRAAGWDGSVKQLTVFEGGLMLIITITGENEPSAMDTAKKIAAKTLANLPK